MPSHGGIIYLHAAPSHDFHHDDIPDIDCYCEPRVIKEFRVGAGGHITVKILAHAGVTITLVPKVSRT